MIDATWFVQVFRNEPYPPRTVFRDEVPEEEDNGPEAAEAVRATSRALWAAAVDALLAFPEAYRAVAAAIEAARRRMGRGEPLLELG